MADKAKKKRVGPITFLRQVRAEGNKVTWTSRQETIQATIFVVIMSILIALFLFTADVVISFAVKSITGIHQ
ncbi:MAG: preprotein translocase subunit SecE [Alphaproteobacteria bacterium]|nr:preprotein translocase subunit SecE [Hyphomonas sp.]MBR9805718.1 preprotein translocase subunit SecE [Alphaproteobacteria bacterium]|tara:strand:- start:732 stop:947 length:216 start_codon:yes stop_codon:yes gene_type:complete